MRRVALLVGALLALSPPSDAGQWVIESTFLSTTPASGRFGEFAGTAVGLAFEKEVTVLASMMGVTAYNVSDVHDPHQLAYVPVTEMTRALPMNFSNASSADVRNHVELDNVHSGGGVWFVTARVALGHRIVDPGPTTPYLFILRLSYSSATPAFETLAALPLGGPLDAPFNGCSMAYTERRKQRHLYVLHTDLLAVDVRHPSAPVVVGVVPLRLQQGVDVTYDSGHLYASAYTDRNPDVGMLLVFDVRTDPCAPAFVGGKSVKSVVLHIGGVAVRDKGRSGKLAYVAGMNGIFVFNVTEPRDVTMLNSPLSAGYQLPPTGRMQMIVVGKRGYITLLAVGGVTRFFQLVTFDLSVPAQPQLIAVLPIQHGRVTLTMGYHRKAFYTGDMLALKPVLSIFTRKETYHRNRTPPVTLAPDPVTTPGPPPLPPATSPVPKPAVRATPVPSDEACDETCVHWLSFAAACVFLLATAALCVKVGRRALMRKQMSRIGALGAGPYGTMAPGCQHLLSIPTPPAASLNDPLCFRTAVSTPQSTNPASLTAKQSFKQPPTLLDSPVLQRLLPDTPTVPL